MHQPVKSIIVSKITQEGEHQPPTNSKNMRILLAYRIRLGREVLKNTLLHQLYSTSNYPCSYLPGVQARSQVVAPHIPLNQPSYSEWVRQGFRRSGAYAYRPHCDHCNACLSLRVHVGMFTPNTTLRKTWQKHHHLTIAVKPAQFESHHFELYKRYQKSRHAGGGMDDDDAQQYTEFLLNSPVDTCLVEFNNPLTNALEMVSVIDTLDDGWSAVYTFFDPEVKGSLGTYAVLWQLAQLKQRQLPWLYLGYWIENSQKMAYKTRFQPCQIFQQGVWTPFIPNT